MENLVEVEVEFDYPANDNELVFALIEEQNIEASESYLAGLLS